MNLSSILHRSTDQYAYVCTNNEVHIMMQTQKGDCETVHIIYGDPYDWVKGEWQSTKIAMEKTGTDQLYDYWEIVVTPPYRRLRYGFELQNENEYFYFGEGGFSKERPKDIAFYFAIPFVHGSDSFSTPDWVKNTVWYQIFPERFANGNKENDPKGTLSWGSTEPTPDNFFGGDLQGVIDHIPYLKELGINGIYFTPIFKAYSNHKYDTIDYFEIDPQFGDKDTLKQLIQVCHEHGIKVMLDAVFNHSGFYFPQFQDVLIHGEASPYKDWFHIREFPLSTKERPNYDTFAFTPFMPKLNTQNPEVRDFLLKVGRYWVEDFDIDGWRLDVANEVDHGFWREFRRQLKEIKPDLYILGEIWHDAMPWLRGDQFDAVMNYPLTRNIIDFFAKETISHKTFVNNLTTLLHKYPKTVQTTLFNLVGSHDTPRILTECGGDKRKVKQIFAFLLSFIGTPCIYYGDEIGMDGGHDPGCRKCMIWDENEQDRELFQHVQKLIALRKKYPLLANDGVLKFLPVESDAPIIAFIKENKQSKVLAVFNHSEQQELYPFPPTLVEKNAVNLWTGEKLENIHEIIIEPKGFCFLEFDKI